MKHIFHFLFKNPWLQMLFFFLLGLVVAFLFMRTAFTPHHEAEKNVPADPITESRGL